MLSRRTVARPVGVAVTSERELAGIVAATMLFRHDMFNTKGNQGRRLLRHVAVLARVASTLSNRLP